MLVNGTRLFIALLIVCACQSIEIEFDEGNIAKLELKINWNAKAEAPNKFVLIMEQKRFMGTEYSSPVLIDDGKLKIYIVFTLNLF